MNLKPSVDDEIARQVRKIAEATGTSLNQPVRDYPAQLAGKADHEADAREIERLSSPANGNSRGWKFNRQEIRNFPAGVAGILAATTLELKVDPLVAQTRVEAFARGRVVRDLAHGSRPAGVTVRNPFAGA